MKKFFVQIDSADLCALNGGWVESACGVSHSDCWEFSSDQNGVMLHLLSTQDTCQIISTKNFTLLTENHWLWMTTVIWWLRSGVGDTTEFGFNLIQSNMGGKIINMNANIDIFHGWKQLKYTIKDKYVLIYEVKVIFGNFWVYFIWHQSNLPNKHRALLLTILC